MIPVPVRQEGARPLARALADELVAAARLLNELAYDLGTDDAVLRRHIASLQSIDQVTQIQLCVADLLREWDHAGGLIGAVPLEDMAGRLKAAMGAGG